jgi:hypothetical protein
MISRVFAEIDRVNKNDKKIVETNFIGPPKVA